MRHWKQGTGAKAPKAFELVSHELACIGQVVLRGTRIVVPRKLRRRVLDLAHEGHQGIVKTKERLRSKVWWPGIDKEAEKKCRECFGCQMVSKHVPPPPIKPTRLPERAWQEIAVDLLGPLPTGEHLLCGGRLFLKMDGSRRASFYYKCCSHQMLRQPFCKVWCASWFTN